MTVYNFPSNPVNGQLYPANPTQGQNQYQWDAATVTWKLLGVATGVEPGTYGNSVEIPTFNVNATGGLSFAANVTPLLVKLNNALGYNNYVWPDSPGTNGQVLGIDSLSNLQWIDPTGPKPLTPNPIYVETWGNDSNSGANPLDPKATIEGALTIAVPGDEIHVGPGNYYVNNPLSLPEQVSIVGADLRRCTIYLTNDDDLFWMRNSCYVQNFTFRGTVDLKGIAAFPPTGAGVITRSPYVQNCTNFVTGSIGLDVDGSKAQGLKSMVLDSFTQFNPGGIGVRISNKGYSQIVSMFTICSGASVVISGGGTASVTNSDSSFGDYGFISIGVSDLEQTANYDSATEDFSLLSLSNVDPGTRPYVGQVLYVGELYYTVTSYLVTDGGEGYTSTPDVTVQIGTGPNAIQAQAVAVVENGSVVRLEPVSGGQNYRDTDDITVTFSGGDPTTPAEASALIDPTYYTVSSASEIDEFGGCTVQLVENLTYEPLANDPVFFYRVSNVIVNSHAMEYVGSGVDILTALPSAGGVPIQENEVVTVGGGKVAITSTDQLGNFRVGQGFVINQTTGSISGNDFTKSLLATIVPYILALS
jgi:hypothetical protein